MKQLSDAQKIYRILRGPNEREELTFQRYENAVKLYNQYLGNINYSMIALIKDKRRSDKSLRAMFRDWDNNPYKNEWITLTRGSHEYHVFYWYAHLQNIRDTVNKYVAQISWMPGVVEILPQTYENIYDAVLHTRAREY